MSLTCAASAAADMCYAVTSNPDISGIGVRVAIYTQTFLSMISASLMPDNNLAFRDSSRTTYIVSCALIASSIAQWKHGGLSLFDGIISTMLTTLMAIFVTANYIYIQTLGLSIQIACLLFTSFWCYWGIQVWSDPGTFGLELPMPAPTDGLPAPDISDCTANVDMVFVVFGRSISATNNGIRIFALCVFALGGLLTLLALWSTLKNLYHYRTRGGQETKETHLQNGVFREIYGEEYGLGSGGGGITRVSLAAGAIGILLLIYFIVTTEQIIIRNPGVRDSLSTWTFGQTLAVIMIGQQLWDIWKCWNKRNEFRMRWSDSEHDV